MQSAQSSMEFMILFTLFLIILAVSLVISWQNITTITQSRLELETTKIIEDVSNRLNTAFLEGDGFFINVTIPEKILEWNYSISIYSNHLLLDLRNTTYSRILLTKNITGSLGKGINQVENRKDEIIITPLGG